MKPKSQTDCRHWEHCQAKDNQTYFDHKHTDIHTCSKGNESVTINPQTEEWENRVIEILHKEKLPNMSLVGEKRTIGEIEDTLQKDTMINFIHSLLKKRDEWWEKKLKEYEKNTTNPK